MTPKRTLPATYIMKWVTFMVVVVLGLWFLRGLQAGKEAGGVEVRAEPAKEVAAPVVAEKPPEPQQREKKVAVAETPREVVSGRPERDSAPLIEEEDYRPASQVLNPPREGQLGKVEEPKPDGRMVPAEDGVYLAKVMRCPEEKMLCLNAGAKLLTAPWDARTAFTKPSGVAYNYTIAASDLEVNDLVRVTVNDGVAIKVHVEKSVRQ